MDYYSLGVKSVINIQFYQFKAQKALEAQDLSFEIITKQKETNEVQHLLDIIKRLEDENRELKLENQRLREIKHDEEPPIPIHLPDPEMLIKQENFFYKEIVRELCKENKLRFG